MTPAERYQLYCRGYSDGAAVRSIRHMEHPDYMIGYEEGRIDRERRLREYAAFVGHKPTILRSA